MISFTPIFLWSEHPIASCGTRPFSVPFPSFTLQTSTYSVPPHIDSQFWGPIPFARPKPKWTILPQDTLTRHLINPHADPSPPTPYGDGNRPSAAHATYGAFLTTDSFAADWKHLNIVLPSSRHYVRPPSLIFLRYCGNILNEKQTPFVSHVDSTSPAPIFGHYTNKRLGKRTGRFSHHKPFADFTI